MSFYSDADKCFIGGVFFGALVVAAMWAVSVKTLETEDYDARLQRIEEASSANTGAIEALIRHLSAAKTGL
jgi:hypothetical protein